VSITIEDLLKQANQAHLAGNMLDTFYAIQELAKRGHSPSYSVLGSYYEMGNQPQGRQLELAYEWYSKSAFEGKAATGYFALGRFFFNGIYVEKNIPHALELFEVAFAKGLIEAGITLGYCYVHGIHVPRNLGRAEQYLIPASIYGYVAATALLAKTALLRRQYIKAAKLYIKSIFEGIKLSKDGNNNPKLYWTI
jgi:hypothetical protein